MDNECISKEVKLQKEIIDKPIHSNKIPVPIIVHSNSRSNRTQ